MWRRLSKCDAGEGGGAGRRPARVGSALSTRSEVAMGAAALAITTLAATLGLLDRGSRTGGLFNAGAEYGTAAVLGWWSSLAANARARPVI